MYKNIFLLSGTWGLGLGASFVQIPSAQNVLTTTGHDSISTVPLGLIILLSAPMAVIIPKLMTKYGEKSIFVFAAFLGCIGAILQMIGLLVSPPGSTFEIAMLMVGAAVQSFTYASTNNIRFADAEYAGNFLQIAIITNAIFAHMLGMFLPSLFSGSVITAFGTWSSTCIGFIIILIGGGLFYVNNSLWMFTIGITVVGIGWNISFVGPSAAVSKVYNANNEKEKSKVQGFNDGIMLFSIGVFQLSASSIYEATGSNWNIFNAILIGFSILAILMTFAKAAVNVNKTTTSLFCFSR
ncbi:hypothetical protein FRACYDRAFT_191003 [Fragilariopsis cylindrus CCMP1102]|uniref:MFS general substrate transporter n=1 Tax=Fragilariopsis cylindrus CCMP1102 TaxID=635003 RepID=A0A1E7F2Q7_9STRA|nr:hypothetical protein FRACYDRAFT_191003 [Fragilariopsis cylindrus CCMP1102]|eukprot:OEU12478.1 hypothetical protein FRACYDRAFT_191003 [Fragilariopsis cylindrus CCMP1102]